MDASLILPAFIAGLLTFLAPCTLPLVPGYLAFISGVSIGDVNKNTQKAHVLRRRVFYNGLSFILGFSVVFIAFGVLAASLGAFLTDFQIWVSRIGGILIVLFGLFMLGVLKVPVLQKESSIHLPKFVHRGSFVSSFLIGVIFAVGWTPCVGPVLGSILLLASAKTTAVEGGFLLAIFSLGLAVPFLLLAVGIGSAVKNIHAFLGFMQRRRVEILVIAGLPLGFIVQIAFIGVAKSVGIDVSVFVETLPWLVPIATAVLLGYYGYRNKLADPIGIIAGGFLISLGILVFTDSFLLLIEYGYKLLEGFGYERLLEYL